MLFLSINSPYFEAIGNKMVLKMKILVTFNCILLLLSFTNCSNNSNDVKSDFDKEILLTRYDSINLENMGILNPVYFSLTDSFIVIQNKKIEYNLTLINRNDSLIFDIAKKGNGPNEIVQFIPVSNNRKNIITFADRAQKKLYSFRIINKEPILLNEISFDDKIPRFFSLNILNDSILVSTGMFSEGRFGLYNIKNKSIIYTGNYPKNIESEQLSFPHIAALYSGTQIGIKPEGDLFAAIYNGLLDIFKLQNNKLVNCKSIYYHFPKFNIFENGPIVGNSKETKEGFRSISCDSNYIYLLYSGKSMKDYDMDAFTGNKIYVYNWQGDPVVSYITDSDLKSIFIEGNSLWGLEKDGIFIF